MARFILNETSYFGAGSRSELVNEIARRGYKKAFIVGDKDLVKFGVVAMVTDTMAISHTTFSLNSKQTQPLTM